MTKKIISLILSLILAISCVPLSVFASENDEITATSSSAALYVESTWCNAGKYAEVNINILDNPGISGAKFSVSYDQELTLISATEAGGVFEILDYTPPASLTSPAIFNWDSLDAVANEDGTIVTLKFAVSNNVSAGDKLNISISCKNGDVYDFDLNSLAVTTVNGYLEVIEFIPGDVNGDSAVNGKDVTLIRRYNAGMDVDINLLAADVNDDGVINGKDVTLIRRVNASWPNVELIPGTPRCDHTLTKVAAKESSCSVEGNIAYWSCSKCDKYFSDEDATVEISLEDTIISKKAHTEVRDDAVAPTYNSTGLTEGWHCSVCKTILVAQEVLPKLEANHHSIIYKDIKTADYPEETSYAEHTGLIDLPDISVPGYKFLGWYTASQGNSKAEKVDYIAVGDTKDYVLFAHWELITYNIRYEKAPVHNNTPTYTVEDTVYLNDPQWSGLAFDYWTNENGDILTKIEKGTTGDLILTAHWATYRNRVVAKNYDKLMSVYDAETKCYSFISYLGVITNVVVDNIVETYTKTTDADYTMSIANTVTVEAATVKARADMAAKSVTASSEWQQIITDSHTDTSTWNIKGKSETQFKIGPVKEKITVEGGYTDSSIDLNSTETTTGVAVSQTGESSITTTNTMSYMAQMSTSSSTSIDIPGVMPNGTYAYVHATDMHMYAIVTYSIEEDCYYLDTYSIMDNMHTMLMYYDIDYDYGSYCDPLAYNIPADEINSFMNSVYFVIYDANTSDISSDVSIMEVHKDDQLLANNFEREGYILEGWSLTPNGDVAYLDKALVKDLAPAGKSITLYAVWKPITYTVEYDANGGTGATASSTHTYDQSNPLMANGFTYYGKKFAGWNTAADGSGAWYSDQEAVENLTNINGDSITLYAQWATNVYTIVYDANGGTGTTASSTHSFNQSKTLTANAFTRDGWAFIGWNTAADGSGTWYDDQASVVNLTDVDGSTVTLYAQWDATPYTINYDANGGEGVMEASVCNVNEKFTLPANAFTKKGHLFVGWSDKPDGEVLYFDNEEVQLNVAPDGAVTLYAIWVIDPNAPITSKSFTISSIRVASYSQVYTIDLAESFDLDTLKAEGYNIHVSVEFTSEGSSATRGVFGVAIDQANFYDSETFYANGQRIILTDIITAEASSLTDDILEFYLGHKGIIWTYEVVDFILTVYFD